MLEKSKNACVLTNGCPENRIDCARMQELLKRNGWRIANDIGVADLILFNACGLTEYAQEAAINKIRKIKLQKQSFGRLFVWGCLPRINPKRLRDVYSGAIFGSDEIDKLADAIGLQYEGNYLNAHYINDYSECSPGLAWRCKNLMEHLHPYCLLARVTQRGYERRYRGLYNIANIVGPNHYYIKAATGCTSRCSYCAVKISRGELRSKSINDTLGELKAGLAAGYKEFALLGTDLGCYGRDRGTSLVNLLRVLVAEKGNYKLKLRNVQPRFLLEMLPELVEVFREGKIGFIISAAQSGNDRILRLMQRGYKGKDFIHAINTLKQAAPGLQVRSQIMVGFPTETQDEFEDSLRLLDKVDFNFVETYQFSARPGTPAEKLSGRIPNREIRKRSDLLIKRIVEKLEAKNSTITVGQ